MHSGISPSIWCVRNRGRTWNIRVFCSLHCHKSHEGRMRPLVNIIQRESSNEMYAEFKELIVTVAFRVRFYVNHCFVLVYFILVNVLAIYVHVIVPLNLKSYRTDIYHKFSKAMSMNLSKIRRLLLTHFELVDFFIFMLLVDKV